jgi:hypothetical protein
MSTYAADRLEDTSQLIDTTSRYPTPPTMTSSIDQLPFDVLFCIALNLDLEDIVRIGQTCRQLRALLDERTLCRRTVEVG